MIAKISGDFEDLQAANVHLAWTVQKASSSQWFVYRDGEPQGDKYDGVKYLEFGPYGDHLAFFAQRGSKWLVVIDGQEHSPGYSDVTPVVFQPRGTSWAFSECETDTSCRIVENGDPASPIYEHVSPPQYSPDGKHLAYLVESKEKWAAMVDAKQVSAAFDNYSCSGFSPDSAHFYFCGQTKKRGWTYVIDGVPGPFFAQLSPLSFSDDGKHSLFGGSGVQYAFNKDETTGTIVLDGKKGPVFEGSGLPGEWTLLVEVPLIAAAPYSGGASVIPALYLMRGRFVSGPQVLSARVNGISDPVFDGQGNATYAARRAPDDAVVIDGAYTGPRFDDVVSNVVFSQDGHHSAYIALRGKDFVEIRDNQPGKAVTLDSDAIIGVSKPVLDAQGLPADIQRGPIDPKVFSVDWTALTPDANRFAYEIVDGKMRFRAGTTLRAHRIVVIDGQPGKKYNAIGISTIHFSEDEKHYCYTVFGADGKRGLVVVDGEESKLYDNVTQAQFDATGKQVIFFGRSGNRLVRITTALN